MEKFKNVFNTTFKQISRSGWHAGAGVAVMTLAFLVCTIFGILAYTSNLFLLSVEQEPQIYAFFKVGTSEPEIQDIKSLLEKEPGVVYVDYTNEEQAKREYIAAQINIDQLAVQAVSERKLPASLGIRLASLDYADGMNKKVLEIQEQYPSLYRISFSKEIVDNIREVFTLLRFGGGIIIGLLLIVIVLFTLLTVEFRMNNRAEEIEIMQLVGGSLGYIRMPFILEGAIYGAIGAAISNLIIGLTCAILYLQVAGGQYDYLREILSRLDWPIIDFPVLASLIFVIILLGFILGSINSLVAIRKYIR